MKKYLVSIRILVLLAVFCLPNVRVLALDASDETPTINWGSPSASWTKNGQNYTTYYQGVSDQSSVSIGAHTTEVVRNVASATLPNLIFNQNCLLDSKDSTLMTVGKCVYFDGPSPMKLFNSRTYANGFLKSAAAVFAIPTVNVIGDSFNSDSNFAYWGKHLQQTTDNTDSSNAFWKQTGYQFNPLAQSYWNNSDPNKNTAMTSAIDRLMQNAKALSPASSNTITSAFDGICYPATGSCTELNQYSDGRVWYSNGPLAVTGGATYSNKATIIVKTGDLTIDGSVKSSVANSNSSLGFIVENGNVSIRGTQKNMNISVFAPKGTITVTTDSSNLNLTGSFVAGVNFSILGSDISFIQDSRDESTWPPGFRDLQPLSSQSK